MVSSRLRKVLLVHIQTCTWCFSNSDPTGAVPFHPSLFITDFHLIDTAGFDMGETPAPCQAEHRPREVSLCPEHLFALKQKKAKRYLPFFFLHPSQFLILLTHCRAGFWVSLQSLTGYVPFYEAAFQPCHSRGARAIFDC